MERTRRRLRRWRKTHPLSLYNWDFFSDGEQQRSRFLYSLRGGLLQGRLVGVINNIDKFNGYEALRQLLGKCQPQARNTTMSVAGRCGLSLVQHEKFTSAADLET